jgi:thiamine biosynthesis lipoprotein
MMNITTLNVMNLPFTIMIDDPTDAHVYLGAVDDIHRILVEGDRLFSPFRSDSLVSRLHRGDASVWRNEEFSEVYMRALLARRETDGLFDPYFRGIYDPTGLTKGWIVEHAFREVLRPLLSSGEIADAAINAGGDVIVSARDGASGWTIGIENPFDTTAYTAAMKLDSGAMATSGTSKRGEHVMRQHTDIVQASVIADSLVDADVWATALLAARLSDVAGLIKSYSLTAFLVTGNSRQLFYSQGSPAATCSRPRRPERSDPSGIPPTMKENMK